MANGIAGFSAATRIMGTWLSSLDYKSTNGALSLDEGSFVGRGVTLRALNLAPDGAADTYNAVMVLAHSAPLLPCASHTVPHTQCLT